MKPAPLCQTTIPNIVLGLLDAVRWIDLDDPSVDSVGEDATQPDGTRGGAGTTANDGAFHAASSS